MSKLEIDGVEIAQIEDGCARALIQMAERTGKGLVASVEPFQVRRDDFDVKALELGLSGHHAVYRHHQEWETNLKIWFRDR
jgi:hypothetical protein